MRRGVVAVVAAVAAQLAEHHRVVRRWGEVGEGRGHGGGLRSWRGNDAPQMSRGSGFSRRRRGAAWLQRTPAFSPSRSEEHTSELQSLMRNSSAVFCLKKKKSKPHHIHKTIVYITTN